VSERRVLLFDDDFESMNHLKDAIKDELGWSVELSAQANVLERLSHERFDLIVADLMIHSWSVDERDEVVQNVHFDGINWRETGLEFLKRLRAGKLSSSSPQSTPPDVAVIVLSAIADESVIQDIQSGPSVWYAEKPFRLAHILDLIRTSVEAA
jgi:CheY-like chemotaxis protein